MTDMVIKTRHINLNSSGNETKLMSGEKARGKTFINAYGIMSAEEKKSIEDD
jgi:hypothetical protein